MLLQYYSNSSLAGHLGYFQFLAFMNSDCEHLEHVPWYTSEKSAFMIYVLERVAGSQGEHIFGLFL